MVTDRDVEEALNEAQRCFEQLACIFEKGMNPEGGVPSLADRLERAKGAADHGSEIIDDLRRLLSSRGEK